MIIKVFFDSLQKEFRRVTRKRKRSQKPTCPKRFDQRLRASVVTRRAMACVSAE